MPLNLGEYLRREAEKLAHRLEPNRFKRDYYQYLEERTINLYAAVFDQGRLIDQLNDPDFKPAIADLNRATAIARHLCEFGLHCDLFDDYTYAVAVSQDETDPNDLASVLKLYNRTFRDCQQKAAANQLATTDLRLAAAITYHLESLKWLTTGICPLLHSPYRLHR